MSKDRVKELKRENQRLRTERDAAMAERNQLVEALLEIEADGFTFREQKDQNTHSLYCGNCQRKIGMARRALGKDDGVDL